MVDRLLVWLGTGVVTAGLSAALLAGAGVATATDGDSSDGGGKSTSESSDSAGKKDDSAAGQSPASGPKDDDAVKDADKKGDDPAGHQPNVDDNTDGNVIDGDTKDDEGKDETTDETTNQGAQDETPGEEDVKDEEVIEDEITTDTDGGAGELVDTAKQPGDGTGSRANEGQENQSQTLDLSQTVVGDFDSATKLAGEDVAKKDALIDTETESGEDLTVVPLGAAFKNLTEETETPEFAAVMFSAPEAAEVGATATAQPLNLLLDLVGTVIFGLYGLVTQLIGGPPVLPPGSSVSVYSSRLRIDCGCAPGEGEEVPVDWYVPENPDPDRIVYLQHGFLAAGPWYSYTAATLAEQTNSIVVAPSITSNFLSYDQCWLGGAPMHQAMAGLFDPKNTALADSLGATEYDGELKWNKVVLMGHSLGGGAVSGIAGYMTDPVTGLTDDRLVGVVLLDGVGLNGEMVNDLEKVDSRVPIYQLAAPKYMWNMFGSGTAALIEARPDAEFYGVTLAGGSHVDTMRGGNFLIQFSQQLVAGFSTPQNVAAAEMLMVGWVNDMFVEPGEPRKGIYLTTGETRTIDTSAGQATLVDLPNSLRRPYLLNFLEPFMALSGGLFTLQPGCMRESTGTTAGCAQSVAV
ncbi:alpha/beta hydrolase [Mycobacterium sp. NPDC051804]|uniref:alpha/beta hydrolase n=1 Tax=Mycobacterium sp. NPDC051804 TaxID=3364295 RepID=UPI00379C8F9D